MSIDEEELRSLWELTPAESDAEDALKKVLDRSSNITAVKDVTSLFIGWVWVVFLGFGASMYSAKRKFELHNKHRRRKINPMLIKNNNDGESQ